MVPKEESRQSLEGNLIQSRAIEMGFFNWPMPTEKVASDQANRPRKVDDCDGHDANYRAPHDFSSKDEPEVRKAGAAKAFIYEWMAYGNAISAKDCTCASLKADWSDAEASFNALVEGVDNFVIYTEVPGRMRSGIKRDYNQMCDVRMLLDLG